MRDETVAKPLSIRDVSEMQTDSVNSEEFEHEIYEYAVWAAICSSEFIIIVLSQRSLMASSVDITSLNCLRKVILLSL